MSSYLVYWKPQNVNWKKPSSDTIRHAASNQFYKVHSGDRLYFITYRDSTFYLLGRMVVEKVAGHFEAAEYLGWDADRLWPADYHAVTAAPDAMRVTVIPCEEALGKLWVFVGSKPQPIKPPFAPSAFQTIRHLTPGSARLLDDLLATRKA